MTPNPAPDAVSDDEIIAAWKKAGGTFYGPHTEHADMEYSKWLPFMRKFAASLSSPAPATEARPKEDERVERVQKAWETYYGTHDAPTQALRFLAMLDAATSPRAETGEGVDALVAKIEAKHGGDIYLVHREEGWIVFCNYGNLNIGKPTLTAALEAAVKEGK